MSSIFEITFVFLSLNLVLFFFHSKISNIFNIFDNPNQSRKTHKVSVALTGGLIIIINIIAFLIIEILNNFNFHDPLFFYNKRTIFSFYFCSILIFLLGVYDDKYDIKFTSKFICQLVIISLTILIDQRLVISHLNFYYLSESIELFNLSIPFTIISIIIFINALNYFDGIDLLCICYSFTIFLILFILGIFQIFSLIIMISLIFLFVLNYKNKLFLGDSGSTLLASIISILMIKSYNENSLLNLEQVLVILFLPVLDLTRITIWRILYNKNPFKGDRNHIHHLLSDIYSPYIAVFILVMIITIPILLSLYMNLLYTSLIFLVFTYLCMISFCYYKNYNNN